MAKTNELVEQRSIVGGIAAPAPSFMDEDMRMGTEDVTKKIRPPFLKIIQKQSSDELQGKFGIGSAILVPDQLPILTGPDAAAVRIVPIYFYVEYLKLAPYALKDTESMIKERSTDPKSDLARRCQDRNLWQEPHPAHPGDAKYNYRNCEALNFLCMFHEAHIQLEIPFILSFSKGSYGKGQNFCNMINMRKRPIFGSVFELSIDPVLGKNAGGEWRRFLLTNPMEKPWIENKDEYDALKSLHLESKRRIEEGIMEAEYDAADLSEGEGSTGEY